jgi:NTP pyrophosphatase (non-canonical NTP hydrolase)
MTFDEYQIESRKTAQYPDAGSNYLYPVLGLCGESGEVAEKFKKLIRDRNGTMSEEYKAEIKKELGDIVWYIAQIASELGISFEDIAETNIEKIMSRMERSQINGDGDNR